MYISDYCHFISANVVISLASHVTYLWYIHFIKQFSPADISETFLLLTSLDIVVKLELGSSPDTDTHRPYFIFIVIIITFYFRSREVYICIYIIK